MKNKGYNRVHVIKSLLLCTLLLLDLYSPLQIQKPLSLWSQEKNYWSSLLHIADFSKLIRGNEMFAWQEDFRLNYCGITELEREYSLEYERFMKYLWTFFKKKKTFLFKRGLADE